MQWHTETIASLRRHLLARSVSPIEIVEALISRIEKIDPTLQGYNFKNYEEARQAAQNVDIEKPLGGIPIAIKDVINVKGQPCTCSSKMLENYVAPYDATVISKLREAGAILLGRTNMDEFAMGSSTENSAWGITRNPWDTTRIPGGSSGGSAAVVAAHEAIAALGSDTGGSIRQPAALCGCVGIKPTYGRVSRYGLVAFASSLDQIGPFAKTVEDAAILLDVISGYDPMENTSARREYAPLAPTLKNSDIKGMRIGVPKEYFVEGMDPEVESRIREAIAELEKLGARAIPISLPHTRYAVAVYYIIATAEASANLARYDGVRYGHRTTQAKDVLEHYFLSREEGFGPEVKRRIILGTYVLSSGYYDAYYNRAQKVRALLKKDFEEAFTLCDVIATPTSPIPAFKIGEKTSDPLQMYLADIYTIAVNLAGICGISIPCGFTQETADRPKLPVGLQLIGPAWGEEKILKVAHAYERATPWHLEKPPIALD
ncbi:MAG: Asp-tRNA(Asn)/Glu-tRNA(Gln) amidotransferase subunit GatA [Methylacidiphilales bacterium]|nr:Asp-tRNA(Asn)/Glu-tRNA(Gln) amidotransferase subunit GatA [Candidatus Methylacidiphilales bacterium]MDW8348847.1 Asp-tRNA(Asn)/Glu-tRNA(Gln) amidotransferase subunit GatA [Verrucomicrobiae bacterium]